MSLAVMRWICARTSEGSGPPSSVFRAETMASCALSIEAGTDGLVANVAFVLLPRSNVLPI